MLGVIAPIERLDVSVFSTTAKCSLVALSMTLKIRKRCPCLNWS